MNNELLLLTKKQTDPFIGQTKTKPQETFKFKINKQMEPFSFSPPLNLAEESKVLLAVTSFEATISVCNISNENNSVSITIPGYCSSRGGTETINVLRELLRLKEQNVMEILVEEVRRKRNEIKI